MKEAGKRINMQHTGSSAVLFLSDSEERISNPSIDSAQSHKHADFATHVCGRRARMTYNTTRFKFDYCSISTLSDASLSHLPFTWQSPVFHTGRCAYWFNS